MRHHHIHGRRSGRPGGWQQAEQPDASDAADWFAGRLPDGWFAGDPTVVVDREEITVIGRLKEPEGADGPKAKPTPRDASPASARRPAPSGCASPTKPRPATAARSRGESQVGDPDSPERILFTHIAVPVMTRLKQPERQVLDTLVDAGVARSRSDALAWSVRLVGEHADEWLGKLRDAMKNVDDLRAEGPEV